ncbi:hypothetical protein LOZ57_006810 [Ophidiomyces ophidiicola]|uniref:uncharacterized protein n=1 Tax=Ophidiomyces ophidiicola TaxID=1387563 RepID=UPI0020C3A963|nr:uncharacterized protein LOZ57_006810 [Ophidiomyces ophidiicola]KAI1936098.1 hypothetical protein LOZ57_006810 [Ophidiomyces ophidiicola]KAI2045057.1 hypothetical protein LOZ43_006201 [Ophidiomyces ophidiicola]
MDKGSRPQLVHTPSQQSVAASSDYYSFSNASIGSDRSRLTVVRYQTPPSRTASPGLNMRQEDASRQAPQPARSVSQAGARTETGTPTPGVDDTPYIRFAIDQLTRDEELHGRGRRGTVASTDDYPVERVMPDEALGYHNSTSRETDNQMEDEKEVPLMRPEEILIPADVPAEGYEYNRLNAVPRPLRLSLLSPLIILCLCMIAALVFCNTWPVKHDGLWDYSGFGDSRYFVFEFLPQLLAILIVIWIFVVQAAVYRAIPLSILARKTSRKRVLQGLPMVPQNFLLPDLSHFRHGEALIGICLVVFWLTNLMIVPLQSSLFQPKWYGSADSGAFQWNTVRPVAWLLVALYVILTAALITIMARFNLGISGLQWDPVSLADIIPLIQKSNVLHDFDQSEISREVEQHIPSRTVRLGYWRTSLNPNIFYALGEENAPVHRLAEWRDSYTEKNGVRDTITEEDVERQQLNAKNSFERSLHSPFVRFRWIPWFLKDTVVVVWTAVAVALLITFIIISFVNRPIYNGFLPLLPTLSTSSGFSPSNFLYSFIPALIGSLFFLAWQPFDVYFRTIQPFCSLSSPNGASADSSLLLAYNSCLPFEATFLALSNGHYKVAYVSFVSVMSLAIPVLAGGSFMARWYPSHGEIRMSTHLPAYYALMVFLTIYMLSFFALWPRRKRYLPHQPSTYADVISFLYQSPLLVDTTFCDSKTKADLNTRASNPPPGEGNQALYAFGIYHGLDGKEHLGIDILRRAERGDMLVSPPPGGRSFV